MVELIIYIIIGIFFEAYLRIFHAKKNGCFYGKTLNPIPEKLKDEINNLHYLATPEWYIQMIGMFFLLFAVERSINQEYELLTIFLQILSTGLIVLGTSASVSYLWQKWINIGSNLPEDWDFPKNKSEFAIKIFGKKISFWWNRGFSGKKRKIVQVFGIIMIIAGLSILILL